MGKVLRAQLSAAKMAELVEVLGDDSFWQVLVTVLKQHVRFDAYAATLYRDGRLLRTESLTLPERVIA